MRWTSEQKEGKEDERQEKGQTERREGCERIWKDIGERGGGRRGREGADRPWRAWLFETDHVTGLGQTHTHLHIYTLRAIKVTVHSLPSRHTHADTDILVNTTKRHCDFSLSCLFSTHWTDLPFKHIQDQHNCTYKTTCMKMQSKESVEYYNSHIKCASHYAPNFKAFLPKRMTPVSLICDLWLAY